MENLKKNEKIKDFITKTLEEKIRDKRMVNRVLNIMSEKYSMTVCEKITELMKKISCFSTEEKVDTLIDNFNQMLVEVQNLDLARRLKYAFSSQSVERLEAGG